MEEKYVRLKNKNTRICLWGTLISVSVLLIVFYATDGLLGDKGFSKYTHDDWLIAILPLSIMIVSAISTLVFSLIMIIPLIWMYPAMVDYMVNKKFSDIDLDTEFPVFDHDEFKRACCRTELQNGLWVSVKEYNLKTKKWIIIEEGRHIENADALISILQEDYKYDRVKFYYGQNRSR